MSSQLPKLLADKVRPLFVRLGTDPRYYMNAKSGFIPDKIVPDFKVAAQAGGDIYTLCSLARKNGVGSIVDKKEAASKVADLWTGLCPWADKKSIKVIFKPRAFLDDLKSAKDSSEDLSWWRALTMAHEWDVVSVIYYDTVAKCYVVVERGTNQVGELSHSVGPYDLASIKLPGGVDGYYKSSFLDYYTARSSETKEDSIKDETMNHLQGLDKQVRILFVGHSLSAANLPSKAISAKIIGFKSVTTISFAALPSVTESVVKWMEDHDIESYAVHMEYDCATDYVGPWTFLLGAVHTAAGLSSTKKDSKLLSLLQEVGTKIGPWALQEREASQLKIPGKQIVLNCPEDGYFFPAHQMGNFAKQAAAWEKQKALGLEAAKDDKAKTSTVKGGPGGKPTVGPVKGTGK